MQIKIGSLEIAKESNQENENIAYDLHGFLYFSASDELFIHGVDFDVVMLTQHRSNNLVFG